MPDSGQAVARPRARRRDYVRGALLGVGFATAQIVARRVLGAHWGGAVFMGGFFGLLMYALSRRFGDAARAEAVAGAAVMAFVGGFWWFFIGI